MNGFIFVSALEASRMCKRKEGLGTTDPGLALSCLMIAPVILEQDFGSLVLGRDLSREQQRNAEHEAFPPGTPCLEGPFLLPEHEMCTWLTVHSKLWAGIFPSGTSPSVCGSVVSRKHPRDISGADSAIPSLRSGGEPALQELGWAGVPQCQPGFPDSSTAEGRLHGVWDSRRCL